MTRGNNKTNQPPGPSYWIQGSIHRAGRQQYNTTDRIPSPLMGEESKVGVKTMRSIVTSLRIKSAIQRGGGGRPSYWLQGSIHSAGHAKRHSSHQPRHCGPDPQSRGAGHDAGKQDKPTNSPSPLDGRGIKGEGDNKTVPSLCHSEQSEESKNSDTITPTPSYWLQGSIHRAGQQQDKPTARSVILASRQYPQGRATTRQSLPPGPSCWL